MALIGAEPETAILAGPTLQAADTLRQLAAYYDTIREGCEALMAPCWRARNRVGALTAAWRIRRPPVAICILPNPAARAGRTRVSVWVLVVNLVPPTFRATSRLLGLPLPGVMTAHLTPALGLCQSRAC